MRRKTVAKFRYTVKRKSVFEELFEIEAESEEEALAKAHDGDYTNPYFQDWVDWYDDQFQIDEDVDPRPVCELYEMVKEYAGGQVDKTQMTL
jgi:hypothetical protein